MEFASRLARIAASIAASPIGDLDAARPLAHLKERLAVINLGVLSIADPAAFSWPGAWIAIVESPDGARMPVAMFGVPSGPLDEEGASALAAGIVVEGLVIAPLDLERPHGVGAYGVADRTVGTVVGIHTAADAASPCIAREACSVTMTGLAGDRYAAGSGTFSSVSRGGQAVTLIAEEAIAEARARGAEIDAVTTRRNLVTRGIDLDPLIGHRLTVGGAILDVVRLAEPCAHLERITRPGVLRGMVHLGGVRADVVAEGAIRLGDEIRLQTPSDEELP